VKIKHSGSLLIGFSLLLFSTSNLLAKEFASTSIGISVVVSYPNENCTLDFQSESKANQRFNQNAGCSISAETLQQANHFFSSTQQTSKNIQNNVMLVITAQ